MWGGAKIAIVLPVYNAQEYIAECLYSILNQTYTNWMAYCVNDGSRDETAQILEDFAKKDDRIMVFHIENGGAAYARNYALSRLQDEKWISFIDADDYIGPLFYETIIKTIGDKDIDYVRLFCSSTPLRYSDQKFNNNDNQEIRCKYVSRESYFTEESVGGLTHSLFIKKSIVINNGISFPNNMTVLEDQVFSITCAIHAKNFLILESPQNYYYYSGNESSITKQKRDSSDDVIRCINKIYSALTTTGSLNILDKFFYEKFLPLKFDILLRSRLINRNNSITEKILDGIRIPFFRFSFKVKMKYLIAKTLKLL